MLLQAIQVIYVFADTRSFHTVNVGVVVEFHPYLSVCKLLFLNALPCVIYCQCRGFSVGSHTLCLVWFLAHLTESWSCSQLSC